MAEFAIVVPLMLILLLTVADLGRIFQAAIVMQSAARAGAEAAAVEYLRTEDFRTSPPAGWSANDYFDSIRKAASVAVCQEARVLLNSTYNEGPPVTCATWPAVAACVHDDDVTGGPDPGCGAASTGFSMGNSSCPGMTATWSTAEDPQGHNYVEVRTCYRFTTLFNLELDLPMASINIGDIYLESVGAFTVADY